MKKNYKPKVKNELHPLGEGVFQIVKVIQRGEGVTLVFLPLLKGAASIPRTFYLHKPGDVEQLRLMDCDTHSLLTVFRALKQLNGKVVLANVIEARNSNYRNIESFIVLQKAYSEGLEA